MIAKVQQGPSGSESEGQGVMTTIAVVTGNPKPQSRTQSVALAVTDALAAELTPSRTASSSTWPNTPPASSTGPPSPSTS